MADVLLDTDVWIDHLHGRREIRARGRELFVSSISRAELFSGASARDEADTIRALLTIAREVPVGVDVAEVAGRIRREHGLRLPDALIAATALVVDAALETRNTSDFKHVSGLRLITAR